MDNFTATHADKYSWLNITYRLIRKDDVHCRKTNCSSLEPEAITSMLHQTTVSRCSSLNMNMILACLMKYRNKDYF